MSPRCCSVARARGGSGVSHAARTQRAVIQTDGQAPPPPRPRTRRKMKRDEREELRRGWLGSGAFAGGRRCQVLAARRRSKSDGAPAAERKGGPTDRPTEPRRAVPCRVVSRLPDVAHASRMEAHERIKRASRVRPHSTTPRSVPTTATTTDDDVMMRRQPAAVPPRPSSAVAVTVAVEADTAPQATSRSVARAQMA